MYNLPTPRSRQSNLRTRTFDFGFSAHITPTMHQQRIISELKNLGVSRAGLSTMESHYLHNIIHVDETVGGVVYGDHDDGFVMLVATNRRIVFLDVKPFFVNEDEINYGVVSGVNYSHFALWTNVTLHTRIKDIHIRTYNKKCSEGFVKYIEEYIELRSLERNIRKNETIHNFI